MLTLEVPDIKRVAAGEVKMVIHALSPLDHIYRCPATGKITHITRIVDATPKQYEDWLSFNSYAAKHPFSEVTLWRVGDVVHAMKHHNNMTAVPVRITRVAVGRLAKTTEDEAELCGFDPLPCPVCEDVRGTIHDLGGCPACGGLGVTETALDAFKRFWDAMHPDGQKWSDDPIVAFIEFDDHTRVV